MQIKNRNDSKHQDKQQNERKPALEGSPNPQHKHSNQMQSNIGMQHKKIYLTQQSCIRQPESADLQLKCQAKQQRNQEQRIEQGSIGKLGKQQIYNAQPKYQTDIIIQPKGDNLCNMISSNMVVINKTKSIKVNKSKCKSTMSFKKTRNVPLKQEDTHNIDTNNNCKITIDKQKHKNQQSIKKKRSKTKGKRFQHHKGQHNKLTSISQNNIANKGNGYKQCQNNTQVKKNRTIVPKKQSVEQPFLTDLQFNSTNHQKYSQSKNVSLLNSLAKSMDTNKNMSMCFSGVNAKGANKSNCSIKNYVHEQFKVESWYGEEVEGLNQKSDCKISNNNSGNGYLNLNKNIAKISENKCREIGDTNSQMNGSTIIDRNIADNSYKQKQKVPIKKVVLKPDMSSGINAHSESIAHDLGERSSKMKLLGYLNSGIISKYYNMNNFCHLLSRYSNSRTSSNMGTHCDESKSNTSPNNNRNSNVCNSNTSGNGNNRQGDGKTSKSSSHVKYRELISHKYGQPSKVYCEQHQEQDDQVQYNQSKMQQDHYRYTNNNGNVSNHINASAGNNGSGSMAEGMSTNHRMYSYLRQKHKNKIINSISNNKSTSTHLGTNINQVQTSPNKSVTNLMTVTTYNRINNNDNADLHKQQQEDIGTNNASKDISLMGQKYPFQYAFIQDYQQFLKKYQQFINNKFNSSSNKAKGTEMGPDRGRTCIQKSRNKVAYKSSGKCINRSTIAYRQQISNTNMSSLEIPQNKEIQLEKQPLQCGKDRQARAILLSQATLDVNPIRIIEDVRQKQQELILEKTMQQGEILQEQESQLSQLLPLKPQDQNEWEINQEQDMQKIRLLCQARAIKSKSSCEGVKVKNIAFDAIQCSKHYIQPRAHCNNNNQSTKNKYRNIDTSISYINSDQQGMALIDNHISIDISKNVTSFSKHNRHEDKFINVKGSYMSTMKGYVNNSNSKFESSINQQERNVRKLYRKNTIASNKTSLNRGKEKSQGKWIYYNNSSIANPGNQKHTITTDSHNNKSKNNPILNISHYKFNQSDGLNHQTSGSPTITPNYICNNRIKTKSSIGISRVYQIS